MAKTYNVSGGDVVLRNIIAFGGHFMRQVNTGMKEVEGLLKNTIHKNISLEDHSLADLAAMGHPYARRAPQSIHSPEYQVHAQSGRLLSSLFSGTQAADFSGNSVTALAYAGVSEDIEYAVNVIMGTSKMIPRDFLIGSLEEIRQQILEILRTFLKNAVINFNGEKTKL